MCQLIPFERAHCRQPGSRRPGSPGGPRGFTLIDLLVSLAVVGVLATLATPSFTAPLYQARRTDALSAVMQLQQAQDRWHAQHGRHAGLDELAALGISGLSPQGHYRLTLQLQPGLGYVVRAVPQGQQRGDRECPELIASVRHGQLDFAPVGGSDAARQSARRCWRV